MTKHISKLTANSLTANQTNANSISMPRDGWTTSFQKDTGEATYTKVTNQIYGHPPKTKPPYTPAQPTTQIPNVTQQSEIILGKLITRIERYAFYGCANLEYLTIPKSVTNIDSNVFLGCNHLKVITFLKRTMNDVQGMTGYPWQFPSGAVIHCMDGDITI